MVLFIGVLVKFFAYGVFFLGLAALFCFSAVKCLRSVDRYDLISEKVDDFGKVIKLFPRSVVEVDELANRAQEEFKKSVEQIKSLRAEERRYKNTFGAFDKADRVFDAATTAIHVLRYLTPDDKIRQKCQEKSLEIGKFVVDTAYSKELFKVLDEYNKARKSEKFSEPALSDEQEYYVERFLEVLRAEGMALSDKDFETFKALKKDSMELSLKFSKNCNDVNTKLDFEPSELEGVSRDFLDSLEKNDQGKLLVGVDYPSVHEIMDNCSVSSSRQRLHEAFNSRAWPENESLLSQLIEVRAKIAKLLGHETFAHKDIKLMMAQSPERVDSFLKKMSSISKPKLKSELKLLSENLPEGVELDQEGRFKLWDLAFVKHVYKKTYLDLDENKIKEYFPLEKTVEGLFKVYQDLLGLEFSVQENVGLWHDEVKIIKVRDKAKDRVQGFVVIDLHPRPNKYSHACEIGQISTVENDEGFFPGVCTVVANLPKQTDGKPALLKFNDASTFFHEFGHALHQILGGTQTHMFSGTSVLHDFVETPSMMFEEWLREPEVLKQLTCHYKTGQSMPDELINKLIADRHFDSGYWAARQTGLARYSLDCYSTDAGDPDLAQLWSEMEDIVPGVDSGSLSKMHASWGHLTGYASKYYTYLWSLVFACDLFEKAKELGLTSTEAGRRIKRLLSKGGSLTPDALLDEFLERKPSMESFGKRFGLKVD